MSAIFSSLAAFVAAGVRPQTALARAIVLVLILKLVGIVAIKIVMFPDSARPTIDAATVERVFGPQVFGSQVLGPQVLDPSALR